jgi:hypothetical protein
MEGGFRESASEIRCIKLVFIAEIVTLLLILVSSSQSQRTCRWSLAKYTHGSKTARKQTEAKFNLKEIKMNSVNAKIEFFSIALIAVAFAAAQVTAMVSLLA